MSFSKDKFIEGFIAETGEHLDLIANSVIELKASSQNKEMISLILRELHTVKGTARMMGYTTIEKLSHGLEDVFKGLREEKYGLNDNIAQLSFITCDCIRSVLDKIRREGSDAMPISKYLDAFEKASSGLFFSTDVFENDFKKDIDTDLQEGGSETESLENITSIRIDLSRINEIVRSFDNLIIRQFRFKHQLEEFESRLLSKEDACVHELPKQLKEELLLTETAIFDTQHLLLNLRMLPLDMVLTPLKREITSDTIKLKKQIDFDVPSTDFMLDKIILEKLRNILMHLVRNSIDHGIESPAERKKKNKSEKGHISISAQQLNNHIVICVNGGEIGFAHKFEKHLHIAGGSHQICRCECFLGFLQLTVDLGFLKELGTLCLKLGLYPVAVLVGEQNDTSHLLVGADRMDEIIIVHGADDNTKDTFGHS